MTGIKWTKKKIKWLGQIPYQVSHKHLQALNEAIAMPVLPRNPSPNTHNPAVTTPQGAVNCAQISSVRMINVGRQVGAKAAIYYGVRT